METTSARRAAAMLLTLGLLTSCSDDAGTSAADPADTPAGTAETSESDPISGDEAPTSPADEAPEDAADAGEATMTISGFAYDVPGAVAPGASIAVTNEDNVGHTVTSDDDGATFDVSVGPGETVTFTAPEEAGEFAFFCRPHPNMTGTLVVEG